ncbi:MAG TPA: bifunctional (p)ppGpp synthetase/guanosine-3',5'-bis(diphosphate) 3'-pyrophosphohydrolase [Steroidobacteraceae bacterium]|jgi:GTP pyrophosphokinase|nr:bifunctional (p)ppGpp synthetase/guanosine-3',5'-bis(diphosphate) 3'-pyrophosphohydrolase [Steroidobacteraceae bacterium]
METRQLCSPELIASIAATRRGIEELSALGPGTLAVAAESAELLGALTADPDLVNAVLVKAAIDLSGPQGWSAGLDPTRAAERLAPVAGRSAADTAAALLKLGDLGLPRNWSPAQGLDARQAETLRKMLLAVVSDPRLILARLAEQLVALRHARDLPDDAPGHTERERRALEARAIFAPLASRLGVWQLKWELEDLAFRYLEPQEYRRIAGALNERRADRERYIEELCERLRAQLQAAGIEAEVYGRPKHMYSIHRKMQRKQLAFEQLFDLRAVRIIVGTLRDCYAALGVVHGLWTYVPGEFDDYIATPKGNFYRSIHTAVIGPQGKSVEVQIRTREMHEHAELGVAAHWTYKEGTPTDAEYQRKIEWVRRLLEPQAGPDADREFLEQVTSELFEDRVYALTPKGEVVDLPRGATPLDFAYSVHTSLGHRCRGAKVNGRIVPLTYALSNGEIVEIITGKQDAPSRDWLAPEQGFLLSPRNRAKVRAWFRKQDAAAADGHEPPSGDGEVKHEPDTGARTGTRLRGPSETGVREAGKRAGNRSPVEVEGVGNLPITLARCCAPLRPQPITGYVTVGRGVTIHRSNCPSLVRMREIRPERLLQVEWSSGEATRLTVEIAVTAYDRRGLVRDLTDVLAVERLSIEAMSTTTDHDAGTASVRLTVPVSDLEQLTRVLHRLGSVPNVMQARRVS